MCSWVYSLSVLQLLRVLSSTFLERIIVLSVEGQKVFTGRIKPRKSSKNAPKSWDRKTTVGNGTNKLISKGANQSSENEDLRPKNPKNESWESNWILLKGDEIGKRGFIIVRSRLVVLKLKGSGCWLDHESFIVTSRTTVCWPEVSVWTDCSWTEGTVWSTFIGICFERPSSSIGDWSFSSIACPFEFVIICLVVSCPFPPARDTVPSTWFMSLWRNLLEWWLNISVFMQKWLFRNNLRKRSMLAWSLFEWQFLFCEWKLCAWLLLQMPPWIFGIELWDYTLLK